MRTKIYLILLMFVCLYSCKEQKFEEEFDSVVIYDYGNSQLGVTYDVPVKFFFNGKEIATFHLYSFSPNLESGIYICSDETAAAYQVAFSPEFKGVNKTFFKGDCKWENNIITGGSVTVDKQGDNYTFIVDVVDNTGKQHYGKYSGKVQKEDWYVKSEIGGIFCSVGFVEGYFQPIDINYIGVRMQMDAGDIYNRLSVSLGFLLHIEDSDITRVYHINPNPTGNPNNATDGVYSNFCIYKNYPAEGDNSGAFGINLTSGTITISRVNEKWQYRIDVDVIAENGYQIKGCFNGGEIKLFGNVINWQ